MKSDSGSVDVAAEGRREQLIRLIEAEAAKLGRQPLDMANNTSSREQT